MKVKLQKAILIFGAIFYILLIAGESPATVKAAGTAREDAEEIILGGEIKESIDTKGDVHWYKFATEKTDDYWYNFEFVRIDLNVSIQITDENKESIATLSVSDKEGYFKLKPDSVYYISVGVGSGQITWTGEYLIKHEAVQDDYADTAAGATQIFDRVKNNGALESKNDFDYMYFIAESDETTIKVTAKTKNWVSWELLDKDLVVLVYGSPAREGTAGSKTYKTQIGKKYYISAHIPTSQSYSYRSMGDYTVTVEGKKTDIAKCAITVKNATLNKTTVKPAVTVKDGNTTLKAGRDYNITYKNNKAVGNGTAVITGIGKYIGSVSKRFKILPAKTTIIELYNKGTTVSLAWEKTNGITGYEIYYSTKKSSGYQKLAGISAKKTEYSAKLSSGKTYYFKVRSYKTVNGTKYYSAYSTVDSIKINK